MSKRPSRGVSSGVGSPVRMQGRDGDLTIRKTREGKILYVKEHGRWHPINTGVDVAQLKKDVDRLIESVNVLRNDNNPFPYKRTLRLADADGTGVKLKNDSGLLKIRNLADSADAIIKAKRVQVDSTTAGTAGATVGEMQFNNTGNAFYMHGEGLILDAATTGDSGDVSALVVLSHTADSVVKFFDGGSIKWTMGYDQSDSNKFKIHNATTLADTSDFILDTDGNLTVAGNVISTAGTLGVGDITGVTLTGDSGGALSDTSGSADFTIAGGTNCASAGSGSTITVNVDDAFIVNNAADIMAVSDFGANAAFKIDADQPATAGAEDSVGLWIDYDRIVAGSGTAAHNDIGIDLDVNSASLGTSSVTGMDIDVVGATSGTHTAVGINLDVDSADTNIGMIINTAGTHMKLVANADADDYATIAVADTGDLTIATVGDGSLDSDLTLDVDGNIELNADNGTIDFKDGITPLAQMTVGRINIYFDGTSSARVGVDASGVTTLSTFDGTMADADFILDAGGDITLDSGTGLFIAKNAGTEFSAANSAYAGMILGYTRIANDGTTSGHANVTVNSSSMTVLQTAQGTDLSINFKAPPSGKVEIQCSFWMGGVSDGAKFSLSTGTSYAELDETHTYDADQNIYIDETDHNYNTICFSVTGLTAGTDTTYYLAGLASGAGVIIAHGRNRTGGTHYPPIILKAIALPATITTGE